MNSEVVIDFHICLSNIDVVKSFAQNERHDEILHEGNIYSFVKFEFQTTAATPCYQYTILFVLLKQNIDFQLNVYLLSSFNF